MNLVYPAGGCDVTVLEHQKITTSKSAFFLSLLSFKPRFKNVTAIIIRRPVLFYEEVGTVQTLLFVSPHETPLSPVNGSSSFFFSAELKLGPRAE